nr:HAD-IB family phosphatase [uncultured Stomatobaculum sp.]
MNVYDFDGTIYRGDSSIDFFVFCVKRYPGICLGLPRFGIYCILYKMGKVSKKKLKEMYFRFLAQIADVECCVQDFWDQHESRIMDWYLEQRYETDVVITASPRFLISEICARLGIKNLIATEVDSTTGKFLSENCHGEEKVKRFQHSFPNAIPTAFYSDSLSDSPMAKIANQAFFISGGRCGEWPADGT